MAEQQIQLPDTSLSSRLSAYRKEGEIRRPEFVKDELVERLDVLDQGQVGPKLGEVMLTLTYRMRADI